METRICFHEHIVSEIEEEDEGKGARCKPLGPKFKSLFNFCGLLKKENKQPKAITTGV